MSNENKDLPLDDQFMILLHKKIMHKSGSAKRFAKKYYTDQYKQTGVIPGPLLLAGKGIMEGRKCSGRARVLPREVKQRFSQMVKASADPDDPNFIFITQEARRITNYHHWLEEEFGTQISLHALYRYVRQENLALYLEKPDFEDDTIAKTYFNPVGVFDLIQVDGCVLEYLKIRDDRDQWQKPQLIEFFDTGSRYIFVLDWYFSESSANSVDLFSRFLLSTAFAEKRIALRPDRAKGFLNLKRPIRELNLKYSMPDGFYLDPDFSARYSPKHKIHLESSHRSVHSFEIRIIKAFEKSIVKTEPGFLFKNGKMRKITVTYLDVDIEQLRESTLIETYRREHNEKRHRFSVEGRTTKWVPKEMFDQYVAGEKTIFFDPADVEGFMKYGFDKKKATVSKDHTITYDKQTYYVASGAEKFSRRHSTKVYVSDVNGKLLIFEHRKDGILLGEALSQGPSKKPEFKIHQALKRIQINEVEQIGAFLESKGMVVNTAHLIAKHRQGLTLSMAKEIYKKNQARYETYGVRLKHAPDKLAAALFSAFLMDYDRERRQDHVAPYAAKETMK
jgi:hypothetical protein